MDLLLNQCWSTVYNAGPALNHNRVAFARLHHLTTQTCRWVAAPYPRVTPVTRGNRREFFPSFPRLNRIQIRKADARKSSFFQRHPVYPASTRYWHNVGLMLVQRLLRWLNISPTLGQRHVFAGYQERCAKAPRAKHAAQSPMSFGGRVL